MKRIKKKKKKGFTLIETLIAITILMISVAAPLSLASKGLQAATDVKDQLIAFYLAQDAYEWVVNRINNNKITNPMNGMLADEYGGATGKLSECVKDLSTYKTSPGCMIDTINYSNTIEPEKYDSNKFLKIDGNGFYQYQDGDDTKFKREVKVIRINENSGVLLEVKIVSIVRWINISGNEQEYKIEGHMTDW